MVRNETDMTAKNLISSNHIKNQLNESRNATYMLSLSEIEMNLHHSEPIIIRKRYFQGSFISRKIVEKEALLAN